MKWLLVALVMNPPIKTDLVFDLLPDCVQRCVKQESFKRHTRLNKKTNDFRHMHSNEVKSKASGWTPKRRKQQSEPIRRWKPWLRSTGPKSPEGRAVVSGNAWAVGYWINHSLLSMHATLLCSRKKTEGSRASRELRQFCWT